MTLHRSRSKTTLTLSTLLLLSACSDDDARIRPHRDLGAEAMQTYQELLVALSEIYDAESAVAREAEVLTLQLRLQEIGVRSRKLRSLPENLQDRLDREQLGTWQLVRAITAQQERLNQSPFGKGLVIKMQQAAAGPAEAGVPAGQSGR